MTKIANIDKSTLKTIELDKKFINKVVKNKEYNILIHNYYKRFIEEIKLQNQIELNEKIQKHNDVLKLNSQSKICHYDFEDKPLEKLKFKIAKDKLEQITSCNTFWDLDVYHEQKVKDFKRTYLCKDKFCSNCKKVIQASRMAKYIPMIDNQVKTNNLNIYHLTLTQPNCSGTDLYDTIRNINKSFAKLNDYLKSYKKIKGIDFELFGYVGAIRSLEITFNADSYHPHLHVLLALDKNLKLKKDKTNVYSLKNGKVKKKFSDEEILIQKIWYLLINNIKVTKKNIDALKLGYSCNLDKFKNNDYNELFKYLTKEMSECHTLMTYQNFKDLYVSTYRIKQIQGYGIFFGVDFDNIDENEVDQFYDSIIKELQKIEKPEFSQQTPEFLSKDSIFLLISRKKVFEYLRKNTLSK